VPVISVPTALVKRSLTRVWGPSLPAVEPRGGSPTLSLRSEPTWSPGHVEPRSRLQEVEKSGIREILCEILAASVWDDERGSVSEGEPSRGKDHAPATRA